MWWHQSSSGSFFRPLKNEIKTIPSQFSILGGQSGCQSCAMGNKLSCSCAPLMRKAYRYEDSPWQTKRRDGHLLRYFLPLTQFPTLFTLITHINFPPIVLCGGDQDDCEWTGIDKEKFQASFQNAFVEIHLLFSVSETLSKTGWVKMSGIMLDSLYQILQRLFVYLFDVTQFNIKSCWSAINLN